MLKEEEIKEGNALIASFMRIKEIKSTYDSYGGKQPYYKTNHELYESTKGSVYSKSGLAIYFFNNSSRYHSSFDWLMPVVEKIEKLGSNRFNDIGITTYSYFEIRNTHINLHWCKDHKYQLHIEVIPKWKDGYNSGGYKKYVKIPVEKECTKFNTC